MEFNWTSVFGFVSAHFLALYAVVAYPIFSQNTIMLIVILYCATAVSIYAGYHGLWHEDAHIKKARIDMKQKKLDEVKSKLDFGPDTATLPIENWSSIQKRVSCGAKLVVIDGLVHDVDKFSKEHPGGIKILESKIGKDATLAFNGAVYRHTKAARNLAAMMRVSRLPKHEIDLKVNSEPDIIPTLVT